MLSTLVLAAGLGTRLDPLTRLVAKPAVPVGDRTLIEHVLGWLADQGVQDVVVNLHHLPASITSVLGDGRHLQLSVRYSWEHPVLGSAGGPRRALPLLASDPFLIVNGDTLSDIDLAAMLAAHRASGADVTMAVVPHRAPDHYNGILADDDGVVTDFVPKGHTVPSWHFVGVQIAQRRVFEGLDDGVPMESVAGIYRDLLASAPGRLRVWPTDVPFLDIGTPRDYLAAVLRQVAPISSRAEIAASARLTRCAVWPEVTIERHVTLEDCIVAGPVTVPSGLEASTAILIPASLARPDDRVRIQDGVALYPMDVGRGARPAID
jgi:NDP-sugar pyrophosphorylase family protein